MSTVALAAMLSAPVVWAQESELTPEAAEQAVLEAEGLGLSLDRLQRRIDRLPTNGGRSLLRLNAYVQVYGRVEPPELLKNYDLQNSAIAVGTPLHQEMLSVMRPNELYPTAVTLNPILGWAWRSLQPGG